jgi:hypothetical protein
MPNRLFVASTGADTNNGQLGSPFRSIAAAVTAATPGGEIVILDSAGYGPFTVAKDLAIVAAPGAHASLAVQTGTGIDVTGGTVVLRGLSVTGAGGSVGIHVANARVHIERCVVSNMTQQGILAEGANGDVFVRDTEVRRNLQEGIRMDGGVRFALDRVRSEGNGAAGLSVQNGARGTARELVAERNMGYGIGFHGGAAGSNGYLAVDRAFIAGNSASGVSAGIPAIVAATVDLVVTGSTIVNNGADGIGFGTQNAGAATATICDNTISGNRLCGIAASGAGATVLTGCNRIARNGSFALAQANGASMKSRQDNVADGNNAGGAQTSGAVTPVAAI